MCEPRRLTTLWASTTCYRDSFTFLQLNTVIFNAIFLFIIHLHTGLWESVIMLFLPTDLWFILGKLLLCSRIEVRDLGSSPDIESKVAKKVADKSESALKFCGKTLEDDLRQYIEHHKKILKWVLSLFYPFIRLYHVRGASTHTAHAAPQGTYNIHNRTGIAQSA
jgi:hypothetical protein